MTYLIENADLFVYNKFILYHIFKLTNYIAILRLLSYNIINK